MPGNKKTCAGTGRSCIGGGNSRGRQQEASERRGWGSVWGQGARAGRGAGVGENQAGTRVHSLGSCGREVLLPQQEGGKASEGLSRWVTSHLALWPLQRRGCKQGSAHDQFSSFPNGPGGAGRPAWAAVKSAKPFQCESHGLGLGLTMQAKTQPSLQRPTWRELLPKMLWAGRRAGRGRGLGVSGVERGLGPRPSSCPDVANVP